MSVQVDAQVVEQFFFEAMRGGSGRCLCRKRPSRLSSAPKASLSESANTHSLITTS